MPLPHAPVLPAVSHRLRSAWTAPDVTECLHPRDQSLTRATVDEKAREALAARRAEWAKQHACGEH